MVFEFIIRIYQRGENGAINNANNNQKGLRCPNKNKIVFSNYQYEVNDKINVKNLNNK